MIGVNHLGRPGEMENTCVVHIPKTSYEIVLSVIGVNSWLILLSIRRDLLFFANKGSGKQDAEEFDKDRHELEGPVDLDSCP